MVVKNIRLRVGGLSQLMKQWGVQDLVNSEADAIAERAGEKFTRVMRHGRLTSISVVKPKEEVTAQDIIRLRESVHYVT